MAPTGSDANDGLSWATAFFSPEAFDDVAGPGDTLLVDGGTYSYDFELDLAGTDGTSGNPIVIMGVPGEQPIWRKTGTLGHANPAQLLDISGIDWLVMENIEIKEFYQENSNVWCGMRIRNSNYGIYRDIQIHDCGLGMRFEDNSDGNLVEDCDFYNNYDPESSTPYTNADGLQFYNVTLGTTNYINRVRMWRNTDDGLDLFDTDGIIYCDSSWAIYNGFTPGLWTPAGDGGGFKLGDQDAATSGLTTRYITNCIASGNQESGFNENEMTSLAVLYNNSAHYNGNVAGTFGSGFEFRDPGTLPHTYKNNIAFNNRDDEDITDKTNSSYNNWDGGVATITSDDFLSLNIDLLLAPRQSNNRLPVNNYLRLVTSGTPSDAIDAGTDVGIPYNGAAPDLGAYETE